MTNPGAHVGADFSAPQTPTPPNALGATYRIGRLVLCTLLVSALSGHARDAWAPVPPADLAATDSTAHPGIDAEFLFSKATLAAESEGKISTLTHLLRAKIYTKKGVDDLNQFYLEFAPDYWAQSTAGRVLKRDGQILELTKENFVESTLKKSGGDRWTKIAIAFPNIEPGDIVDFRYVIATRRSVLSYRDFCQETLPVREYHFLVESFPTNYLTEWNNCKGELKSDGRTRMDLTVRDLPAFEHEEFMPAETGFRGWISIIYNGRALTDQDQWEIWSGYWDDEFQVNTRGGTLKKLAAELTAGAPTDEEKLRRLYDYCQREIANYGWTENAAVKASREKRKAALEDPYRSGAQALTKKEGWPEEINYAFAALARALGYEVKEARTASRTEMMNIQTPKGWAYLDRSRVAVKTAGKWRIFNPGSYFTPYGMLGWTDEFATALLCGTGKVAYQQVPVAPAAESPVERKGRFALDAEGTLTGEVEESSGGHVGISVKVDAWDQTPAETEKEFREELAKRIPTAEVSDLRWENLRTRDFPVKVHYKVRVPGYAEQAGKRLTVAPGFFEAGAPVVFAAEKRKLPVFFHYTQKVHDDIEIALPDGFVLDSPNSPADVGDASSPLGIGCTYRVAYKPKHRTLIYDRTFILGDKGLIAFRLQVYPRLKKVFEELHTSDTLALVIRPEVAGIDTPEPAPADADVPSTP